MDGNEFMDFNHLSPIFVIEEAFSFYCRRPSEAESRNVFPSNTLIKYLFVGMGKCTSNEQNMTGTKVHTFHIPVKKPPTPSLLQMLANICMDLFRRYAVHKLAQSMCRSRAVGLWILVLCPHQIKYWFYFGGRTKRHFPVPTTLTFIKQPIFMALRFQSLTQPTSQSGSVFALQSVRLSQMNASNADTQLLCSIQYRVGVLPSFSMAS